MSEISWTGGGNPARAGAGGPSSANLADLLERILDKGIVIVGDIRVNLLDIELLTIKLRLLVASVDRAKEMGIDWWEHDPSLSSRARQSEAVSASSSEEALLEENRRLRERLDALEARTLPAAGADGVDGAVNGSGDAEATGAAGASASAGGVGGAAAGTGDGGERPAAAPRRTARDRKADES
ncbi:gas vesicle protein [Spirillospora sp. NPDC029432]|uniref:gas vesicle protein n=1 Tax=Spirillospora sp. NPDC029432 TaxID=3154599 RepID=UPI003454817F